MANTTWNSSDKSANLTLSGSNLTVTSTSAASAGVRSVTGKRTGKWYVEFTCTTFASGGSNAVGVACSYRAIDSIWSGEGIAANANGTIYLNFVNTGLSIGAIAGGDIICMAVDLPNRRVWFRKNGGSWNATSGSAYDPTDATTGALMPTAAQYLGMGSSTSGNVVTANVGGTAFTYSVPSGYSSGWDDVSTAGVMDLGAVGCATLLPTYLPAVTVTPAAFSTRATLRNDAGLQTSPMITGTVKQSGVAVARTVRAYRRLTGEVLGETVSDGSTGAFSINARGKTDNCYVVALDDLTAAPDYNALIFDLVIPV